MTPDQPRIFINDSTLRDGEQAPRVAFTARDKLIIARALANAGIDEIEVGTPAMGREEIDAIAGVVADGLPCRVMAWCRLDRRDIDAAAASGVTQVNVSAPMSRLQIAVKLGVSVDSVANRVRSIVSYAREKGLTVALGGEDASRADPRDIGVILRAAAEAGVWRYRFADTVGALDPFTTFEAISRVRQETELPIEFHGHDDFGLATANTLAAIHAGATHASVTVLGLGERAGNAPLEEIAAALGDTNYGRHQIRLERLNSLARLVAKAARRRIGRAKAIVGADVFTHESGIHVAALLKDVRTYQGIDPALLGRRNKVVIAKHSGVAALKSKCAELGFEIDRDLASLLLTQIRQRANDKVAPMTRRELKSFVETVYGGAP